MSVRVRFAPSPTGPLHIGGIRTALYNYLFARQQGGSFVLRIEDTDQTRYVEGAEDYITESLEWAGLIPDESPVAGGAFGPYRQSERKAIYAKYAEQLVQTGLAYYAFDTPEELEQMREVLKTQGNHSPKYDSSVRLKMLNSLSLTASETQRLLDVGTPYTIRLKVPEGQTISFIDRIRGSITFNTEELDDKVLLKAGGMPTYHLANVVDDHLMEISHVIRGEEWLPSTAHHVLLYRAFGWDQDMPEFAHLPLILKPSGKGKLSKRDGAKFGFPVFPLKWDDDSGEFPGFREFGFLPEAMINFLAFLGWNPGTEQEIFEIKGLIEAFSLDQVTKSGARFDFDKALWFNSQYIQESPNHDLARMVRPMLREKNADIDPEFLESYCGLFKERAHVLQDLVDQGRYFFEEPDSYDESIIRKKWNDPLRLHFERLHQKLIDLEKFDQLTLEGTIKGYIEDHALRFGDVLQLLRCSVSGSPKGPDVFLMLSLLGQEKVTVRLGRSIEYFSNILAIG